MSGTTDKASTTTSLTLIKEVRVHPIVLASVIDAHTRRNSGTARVVGAITGVVSEDGAVVDISDCFPVTFDVSSDNGGTVRLDIEMLQLMKKLRKRTAPHESLVGWFSSMMEIPETSAVLHSFFSKETTQTMCMMLCVDATSSEFKTYVSDCVSKPQQMSLSEFFHEVPSHLGASEMERLTMSVLCKADAKSQAESTAEVPLDKLFDRDDTLQSLKKMITVARECAKNPDDPKFANVDPKVREELNKIIARIDDAKPEEIEKVFTENVTDVLMISYVASLARGQLQFAQRLRSDLGRTPDFSVANPSTVTTTATTTTTPAADAAEDATATTTTATTTTATTTTAQNAQQK